MPSREYLRRQAEVCFKLAVLATEGERSRHLIALAEEYRAKAADQELQCLRYAPSISPEDQSADQRAGSSCTSSRPTSRLVTEPQRPKAHRQHDENRAHERKPENRSRHPADSVNQPCSLRRRSAR